MEDKKCIIKSKEYNNLYYYGSASYGSDISRAIFSYNELPEYIKNSNQKEIIFLDTEEGLELLVNEIEKLDNQIPQEELKLNEMKQSREKIYESTPKVGEYIKLHNKLIHPLIGISSDTKKDIVKRLTE